MISSTITKSLEHDGVTLVRHAEVKSVSAQCPYNGRPRTYRDPHGQNNITLTVSLNGGKSSSFAGFDEVIYAIGRSPAVEGLGLEHVPGVHVDAMTNHIQNDAFSNTGAQVSNFTFLCVATSSYASSFFATPPVNNPTPSTWLSLCIFSIVYKFFSHIE